MRRGEILALRWKNLDLAAGVVRVVASLEQTKAGIRFKPTKTEKGRAVTLPGFAIAELRRWKREQAEKLLRLGIRQSGETLVCGREDGKPKQPDSLTHEFTYLVGRAGLKGVRFHDLRHSHATQLLAKGVHPRSFKNALAILQSRSRWTFIRMSRKRCRAMRRQGSTRLTRTIYKVGSLVTNLVTIVAKCESELV
jgi:integrase